jgi:ABC-type antimicrobial peptide transport system permease subunit
MVLLIACANVANLKMAQSATRSREMALRVAIGAGRGRLVQMLLVENAMLAVPAAGLGALFAWRSAPLVVTMIQSSDSPVRLLLYADWRVLGFGAGLVFFVFLLFGVVPALRTSVVKPVSALKGGDDDPHSRRRLMHGMIATQIAFCFLVIFMSGLFVRTFESLSNKPLGFSPENLLLLDVVAQQGQPPVVWDQIADKLRNVPGVERVAIAGWPLLIGAALGIASVRYVETLLYGMKGSDPVMLTGPALVLLAIALLFALPVIVRASRIDPKVMLRAE